LTEKISGYFDRDENQLVSYDYDVLKRRFEAFIGPNYSTGAIESGIERITNIKPPFNKEGISRINAETLRLSAARDDVRAKWKGELTDSKSTVGIETTVPKEKCVPAFTFWNVAFNVFVFSLQVLLIKPLWSLASRDSFPLTLLSLAVILGLSVVLFKGIKKLSSHFNPVRSVKTLGMAVYRTLSQCNIISRGAKVVVLTDKQTDSLCLKLRDASVHDQNVFNTAMAEMLSPIENPRYILISKNRFKKFNYRLSFACPSVLGKKKEFVEKLSDNLKGSTGKFEPVYTHCEGGRQLILKCRKRSYITFNEKQINKKYKVSHWN
jgi:hypothetical protein